MKQISVHELKLKMDNKEPFQLIDVREIHEYKAGNIGGENIPMDKILSMANILEKEIPVIIHCRSGKRSGAVVHALTSQLGVENLYNLTGGIHAWSIEIDTHIEVI